MDAIRIAIRRHIEDERLVLGIVRASGTKVGRASGSLKDVINEFAQSAIASGEVLPKERKSKVRHMLKIDGFSPSGRNRPASEFLVRELERGRRFRFINNVVDINNYLSLRTSLPMSVFDTGKLLGALVVRTGNPGEAYVFNRDGHVIDVKKMVVCCEEQPDYTSIPFGSPIKDSMHTKVQNGTDQVVAVIYSPSALYDRDGLGEICSEMAGLFESDAGADDTAWEIR